jgi:plasmid stabilization system protein ParE
VIESIKQLKMHPRMGSLFQGSVADLRSWPVKDFDPIRIYYLFAPECLRVVRVLHGKRNVRQILQQERASGR